MDSFGGIFTMLHGQGVLPLLRHGNKPGDAFQMEESSHLDSTDRTYQTPHSESELAIDTSRTTGSAVFSGSLVRKACNLRQELL